MTLGFTSSALEEVLREGAARLNQSSTSLLDARVLLKHVLTLDDTGLIVEAKTLLSAAVLDRFAGYIERRQNGEPVAYITGVQEFWSLEFKVTPEVLIPRGDSECLIEAVLQRRDAAVSHRVLDLGVGSGCLLCALLHDLPQSSGVGVDRSQLVLNIANANARSIGIDERATFLQSCWTRAVEGVFDIIITNPPYIPDGQRESLAIDVAGFEPSDALFAGSDGLDDYREILSDVARVLSPAGLLIFEVGDAGQAQWLMGMLARVFPGEEAVLVNDLENRARGVLIDRKTFANRD